MIKNIKLYNLTSLLQMILSMCPLTYFISIYKGFARRKCKRVCVLCEMSPACMCACVCMCARVRGSVGECIEVK